VYQHVKEKLIATIPMQSKHWEIPADAVMEAIGQALFEQRKEDGAAAAVRRAAPHEVLQLVDQLDARGLHACSLWRGERPPTSEDGSCVSTPDCTATDTAGE
jgi:hypothetical protein